MIFHFPFPFYFQFTFLFPSGFMFCSYTFFVSGTGTETGIRTEMGTQTEIETGMLYNLIKNKRSNIILKLINFFELNVISIHHYGLFKVLVFPAISRTFLRTRCAMYFQQFLLLLSIKFTRLAGHFNDIFI